MWRRGGAPGVLALKPPLAESKMFVPLMTTARAGRFTPHASRGRARARARQWGMPWTTALQGTLTRARSEKSGPQVSSDGNVCGQTRPMLGRHTSADTSGFGRHLHPGCVSLSECVCVSHTARRGGGLLAWRGHVSDMPSQALWLYGHAVDFETPSVCLPSQELVPKEIAVKKDTLRMSTLTWSFSLPKAGLRHTSRSILTGSQPGQCQVCVTRGQPQCKV